MREVVRNGVRWSVREMSSANVPGARAPRCLIFDSDGVVRRLWVFPQAWQELSDGELWALVEGEQQVPAVVSTPHEPPCRAVADEPRIVAAMASAMRARMTLGAAHAALEQNRALRADQRALLDDCNRVRAELRQAIEAFAASLRADGVAPERALVLIKDAMQQGLRPPLSPDEPGADELVHDGVAWGIAAYFAA